MTDNYLGKGAKLSACGRYRYRLWREWRLHPLPAHWDMWTEDDGSPALDGAGQQIGEPLSCVFVMLNPSTADANEDDPTIRRCVSFAKSLGYDRLEVVNLFAWRATKPKELLSVEDPVGWENQHHIHSALSRAGIVIAAWGVHGGHLDQDETMLGWIEDYIAILAEEGREVAIMSLGVTKDGFPRHPLYLPANAQAAPYKGRGKRVSDQ